MKAFIFDFDGTLADTLPVCVESFRRALERHTGRRYTDAEITAHFGLDEEGILRRMAPECWSDCLATFLHQYEVQHAPLKPFEGIDEMLRELRSRGVQLAMVTGKGRGSAVISLRHFGLEHFFAAVEVGSAERNEKGERIRDVLLNLGLSPGEAAYIGDSPADMTSAREAGVLPLAAAWMPGTDIAALEAASPAVLFRSVDEFRLWVDRCGWTDRS